MWTALLFAAMLVPAVATADPLPLTAWRTSQGVFLSWSASGTGAWHIWRGTVPGRLEVMATLPAGQSGFLDLSAGKDQGYFYGLGPGSEPSATVMVRGTPPPVRVMAGLVTTCIGLAPGGTFPANTQNYFLVSRDVHVQYYGYFLLKPADLSPREVSIVWRDPSGEVFSEYSHSVIPKPVELPGGAAAQIIAPQAIGLRQVITQNGQKRLPSRPGLYTIELSIDSVPVALTIFYIREESAPAQPSVPRSPESLPAPATP